MRKNLDSSQATEASDSAASPALGLRIKYARTLHGMTLKALAQAAQCSESLLSRIERNQAMPSLSNLHRLATALHTNVAELTLSEAPNLTPVMRQGERPVVQFGGHGKLQNGVSLERVITPIRGQLLQADIHVLAPGARNPETISHVGEEVGYVIEGQFELRVGETTYSLNAGDTFYFSSDEPHSYCNPGESITRVLWVNTPATF